MRQTLTSSSSTRVSRGPHQPHFHILTPVPFLYNFSPNVVPPPLDWTEWIHVTGYWFLENAEESAKGGSDWEPPDGLLEFMDKAKEKGKKIVYMWVSHLLPAETMLIPVASGLSSYPTLRR